MLPAVRRRILAMAVVPMVGGLLIVALLPTVPQGGAASAATVFGLALAAGLVSWLVRSAAALRQVARVEISESDIRTHDVLRRERRARWERIADIRATDDGQWIVVGQNGVILARLNAKLADLDVLVDDIRRHIAAVSDDH